MDVEGTQILLRERLKKENAELRAQVESLTRERACDQESARLAREHNRQLQLSVESLTRERDAALQSTANVGLEAVKKLNQLQAERDAAIKRATEAEQSQDLHRHGRKMSEERSVRRGKLLERTAMMIRNHLRDYQCAGRCDGPHEDCPCWYCSMSFVVRETEEELRQ